MSFSQSDCGKKEDVLAKLKKNSSSMNWAGTCCGCAALLYLAARTLFSQLAGLILSIHVPGATLANPVGASLGKAALLRSLVSILSLTAPFLLLRALPLKQGLPLGHTRRRSAPGLFLLFWGAMFLGNTLSSLAVSFEHNHAARIHLPASGFALIAAWISVCLIPAFGEELLFRGLLQGWLREYGLWAAVFGQGVLFSLLHGRFSACIAALFGGIALGLCAEYSGSLRLGILFHLYNNSLAFISQYATQFWGPAEEKFLSFLILIVPPIAALVPILRSHFSFYRTMFRTEQKGGAVSWPMRCPGWMLSAGFLFVLCIVQSYF